MSERSVIIDPLDRSRVLLGGDGALLLENIHDEQRCAGRGCIIHHPSDHHMRTWPTVWRDNRGLFERQCIHGIGHPDPDDVAYWNSRGEDYQGQDVHGCDGCCRS